MELIADASEEKLRGGFYTPAPIADFILKWAMNGNKDYDILEPSCGDGAFLQQIKKMKFEYNSITGIEIDKVEAQKARALNLPSSTIFNKDFFLYCNSTNSKFDLIIGNPPYIRYQYFDKQQRAEAEKLFFNTGLKYTKLTNTWVPFVVGSSILLKDNGKLGFVLPAELLQVSYAKQLRRFIASFFNKINIISFRTLIFPDIQQEVILLLCERNNTKSHLIEHIELDNLKELISLDITKLKCLQKRIDFSSNKWTFYFLEQAEIDFIENIIHQHQIFNLRHYATVEVGMTTGSNIFFTVPLSVVDEYQLHDYAKPMVGRSVQVIGALYTEKDWKQNIETGARAYFLDFPPRKELIKHKNAINYLELAEKQGIQNGFKCRIRNEWQIQPSAWISEALFTRRNNIYPKLVINKIGAYTTDTMHRVSLNKSVELTTLKRINIKAFVASYYNSLSLAFAEICGRSHGGGALELMPNEVEDILLPYDDDNANILNDIDKMLRSQESINEILKFTDPIILRKSANLSEKDIQMANKIWKKLLNRRLIRNGHKRI